MKVIRNLVTEAATPYSGNVILPILRVIFRNYYIWDDGDDYGERAVGYFPDENILLISALDPHDYDFETRDDMPSYLFDTEDINIDEINQIMLNDNNILVIKLKNGWGYEFNISKRKGNESGLWRG